MPEILLDLSRGDAERILAVLEHHYAYVTLNTTPVTDLIVRLKSVIEAATPTS